MYTLLAIRNGTQVLNYDKAYTSLSLLALLQTPMSLILDAIAGIVAAVGALQRIGEYLSQSPAAGVVPSRVEWKPDEEKKDIPPYKDPISGAEPEKEGYDKEKEFGGTEKLYLYPLKIENIRNWYSTEESHLSKVEF